MSLGGVGCFRPVQARPGPHSSCVACLVPETAPCFCFRLSQFTSTRRHAWVSPDVFPLVIKVRTSLYVCHLAALVDLPCRPCHSLPVPLCVCWACVHSCMCVSVRMCMSACAHTLMWGPGVSPPVLGVFCACKSVPVVCWWLVHPEGCGLCPACVVSQFGSGTLKAVVL